MRIAVTGGAGYVGALVVTSLRSAGHDVIVLDSLLHGQDDVGRQLEGLGAQLLRADLRERDARRELLSRTDAVVHLAAIVGDPACKQDPETSHGVNVLATRALIADARESKAVRFVFASTCSNYGRMADPTVPIGEDGVLAPVSLYAEQKVAIERDLLGIDEGTISATCLRFATVYGVAPRMRFDLTVNEFTRDLWSGRNLEVFGEQFWRPYVHVADAARAVLRALEAPREAVGGKVFNVGHSDENYRKVDLVDLITSRLGRGNVTYVHRDEDPRDYKVSFERVRNALGFEPEMRVPGGVEEVIRGLEAGAFGDAFDPRYSNVTSGANDRAAAALSRAAAEAAPAPQAPR